jgi:putative membrane protein
MLKAARNLRMIILTPSLILAWSFGIFLFATFLVSDWAMPFPDLVASVPHWFWGKLILVLGLSGYHGFLSAEGRKLASGQRRHSERYWRLMSEVPFLVAIAVVLLATLEP